jgi:retinol dehydrogenase-12
MSGSGPPPMDGKTVLVTGANVGIGLETARGLARAGATVVVGARDRAKGEAAVRELRESTGRADVGLLLVDLASLDAIRAASREMLDRYPRLDVLVNNAGLIQQRRTETEDGFESTFGINHLGTYALTLQLLDRLKESAPARVVNVASEAHRSSPGLDFDDLMRTKRKYAPFPAYGDSKLANILFTRALARRLEGTGVVTHALHPGVVRTGFGMDGDLGGVAKVLFSIVRPFLMTPEKGAATSLHVAMARDAGATSGEYWSKSERLAPSAAARDEGAAERLWAVSEELTGVDLVATD